MSPSLEPRGGGQHSLAGDGAGEPIWTTGEKAWHSVYSETRTETVLKFIPETKMKNLQVRYRKLFGTAYLERDGF
jgi:hypothetical protein